MWDEVDGEEGFGGLRAGEGCRRRGPGGGGRWLGCKEYFGMPDKGGVRGGDYSRFRASRRAWYSGVQKRECV